MVRSWMGDGPEFSLRWGGRDWSLNVADPQPGLQVRGENVGPLLALEGIATVGCGASSIFGGASIVGFERRFERVEATYAFPDWDDLSVRAAWSPSGEGDEGVDLEIQASTLSVGRLKGVEIKIVSMLPEPAADSSRIKRWVEPRTLVRQASATTAASQTSALTTLPLAEDDRLVPQVIPSPWDNGSSYVEMVLPP